MIICGSYANYVTCSCSFSGPSPSRRTLLSGSEGLGRLGFCIPIQMLCRQQVSHEELLVSAYLKSPTFLSFLSMCMWQGMQIGALLEFRGRNRSWCSWSDQHVFAYHTFSTLTAALDPPIQGQTQCKPRHSCFLWMLKDFEFFCAISASLAGAVIEDPVHNSYRQWNKAIRYNR